MHPFLTTYHHLWVQGFLSFTPMSLPTDPSVFNILTLFCSCWFLSRDWLVSFITSAQWTDGGPINWVKFLPTGHSHLVRCALKLTPSIPVATAKWVIFVYILEVINDSSPSAAIFTPCCCQVPCVRRTCKPKESGAQPVEAMALDAPSPVALDRAPYPDPTPCPLGNMGIGVPSSEEQVDAGTLTRRASFSSGVSPVSGSAMPLARSWVEGSPSPPSILGVCHSPPLS